jgi:hypothetical protein
MKMKKKYTYTETLKAMKNEYNYAIENVITDIIEDYINQSGLVDFISTVKITFINTSFIICLTGARNKYLWSDNVRIKKEKNLLFQLPKNTNKAIRIALENYKGIPKYFTRSDGRIIKR